MENLRKVSRVIFGSGGNFFLGGRYVWSWMRIQMLQERLEVLNPPALLPLTFDTAPRITTTTLKTVCVWGGACIVLVCICLCVFICAHVSGYMYICVCDCVYLWLFVFVYVCLSAHICLCECVCVYTCESMYINFCLCSPQKKKTI